MLSCSPYYRSGWGQQSKEVAAAQEAAARAGDKLRGAIAQKERGGEEAQRDIEVAKLEAEKHLAERVVLELEVGGWGVLGCWVVLVGASVLFESLKG